MELINISAQNYKEFIAIKMKDISQEKTILDVGGGSRFQKWLKEYQHLFKDEQYQTMDLDAKSNPDIVGDIHKLPMQDESLDAIICYAVLEHVHNPIRAIQEIYRVLKKGGKLFIYVPSIYPYHSQKGHYPDMWRFFDDTIIYLCRDFSKVEICKVGGYFKALSFFAPRQHKMQGFLAPLAAFLDNLFKTDKKNTTSGYYVYVIK